MPLPVDGWHRQELDAWLNGWQEADRMGNIAKGETRRVEYNRTPYVSAMLTKRYWEGFLSRSRGTPDDIEHLELVLDLQAVARPGRIN